MTGHRLAGGFYAGWEGGGRSCFTVAAVFHISTLLRLPAAILSRQ